MDLMRKFGEVAKPLPYGAGRGNRTPAERLEISRSTIKLYPRVETDIAFEFDVNT